VEAPFIGARPFAKNEWQLFHGRDRDTALIAARVLAEQLVVVCGPSGVGKSSILEAGLKRYLEKFNIDMRSESQPGACLAALRELAMKPPEAASTEEQQHVFALDQFERLLRNRCDRVRSASAIKRALKRGHRIVLVVREEALSWLVHIKAKVPTILSNVVRLDPLNRDGIFDAITKPLQFYNEERKRPEEIEVHASSDLLEKLADRLAGDPVGRGRNGATALQVVMRGLWDNARDKGSDELLPPSTWGAGLKGSAWIDEVLTSYVDRCLSRVASPVRFVWWGMLPDLISPGGGRLVAELPVLETGALLTRRLRQHALRELQRVGLVALDDRTRTAELAHDFIAEEMAFRLKRRRARAKQLGALGFGLVFVAALSLCAIECLQYRKCAQETPLVEGRCEDEFALGQNLAAGLFSLGAERLYAQKYVRRISNAELKACEDVRREDSRGWDIARHAALECEYLPPGRHRNPDEAGGTFADRAFVTHHHLHRLAQGCGIDDKVPNHDELLSMDQFFQRKVGATTCTQGEALKTNALRNCVRNRNRDAADVLDELLRYSPSAYDVDTAVEVFVARVSKGAPTGDTLRDAARLWMRAAREKRGAPIARELATFLNESLADSRPGESEEAGRHLGAYRTLELTWRDDIALLPGRQSVCAPSVKMPACNQRAPELFRARAGFVREAAAASALVARAAGERVPADFVANAATLLAQQAMALAVAGPPSAQLGEEWMERVLEDVGLVDAIVRIDPNVTGLISTKCSAEVARALATMSMDESESIRIQSVRTACERCLGSSRASLNEARLELQDCGNLLDAGRSESICSTAERAEICDAIAQRGLKVPKSCTVALATPPAP
jgi:hypothetical protein